MQDLQSHGLQARLAERGYRDFEAEIEKVSPYEEALRVMAVHDGLTSTFAAGLDGEARGQLECLGSRDFVEGVAAFLGKRDPKFTGE